MDECHYMHAARLPMPSGASSGSRGVPRVAIASLAVCWSANTMLPAAMQMVSHSLIQ